MTDTISWIHMTQNSPKPVFDCPECGFTPYLWSDIAAQPLLPWFQSWFAPEVDEKSKIRDHLAAVEVEQTRLKKERQKLQAALDQVDSELLRLENITSGLTGAVSHLRHFPTEILQFVFELVNNLHAESEKRWTSPPIWAISYVCSRWRKIALSTPTLWINIYAPSCHWCGDKPSRAMKSIEHGVDRSQNFPLNYSLGDSWGGIYTYGTDTCYACQLLVKLSPRIRHLDYWTHHGNHWETGLRPTFPQLRTLRGFLDHPSSIFQHAPLLRAADVQFKHDFSQLHFPWAQLTYLNLDAKEDLGSSNALLQVLQYCVDLIFLGLKMRLHMENDEELQEGGIATRKPLVTLSRLRILHVIDENHSLMSDPSSLHGILPRLRCPHLESLTTVGFGDVCHEFIVESGCQGTLVDLFVGLDSALTYQNRPDNLLPVKIIEELSNVEAVAIYPYFPGNGAVTFKNNALDQLCNLLNQHMSNTASGGLRVVRTEKLQRPPSYLQTGQLWRNSFAYFLHRRWNDCSEFTEANHSDYPSQHRSRINSKFPQRLLPQIQFQEFVHENIPAGIVACARIKYLCLV